MTVMMAALATLQALLILISCFYNQINVEINMLIELRRKREFLNFGLFYMIFFFKLRAFI